MQTIKKMSTFVKNNKSTRKMFEKMFQKWSTNYTPNCLFYLRNSFIMLATSAAASLERRISQRGLFLVPSFSRARKK